MSSKALKTVSIVGLLGSVAFAIYYLNKKNKTPIATTAISETSIAQNVAPAVQPNFSKEKGVFGVDSGYQVFDSGLIIQFGNGGSNIVFPIPFPNACLSAGCSTDRNSSGSRGTNHVTNVSNRGMIAVIDGSKGYWWAYGY